MVCRVLEEVEPLAPASGYLLAMLNYLCAEHVIPLHYSSSKACAFRNLLREDKPEPSRLTSVKEDIRERSHPPPAIVATGAVITNQSECFGH